MMITWEWLALGILIVAVITWSVWEFLTGGKGYDP